MKIRTKKKGLFIIRRQKKSDKSFSLRESMRLAYFDLMNIKSYIIKKRGTNNVVYVVQNKKEAYKIFNYLNNGSK